MEKCRVSIAEQRFILKQNKKKNRVYFYSVKFCWFCRFHSIVRHFVYKRIVFVYVLFTHIHIHTRKYTAKTHKIHRRYNTTCEKVYACMMSIVVYVCVLDR